MTFIAGYAVVVGVFIAPLWTFSIVRGRIPELLSRPWEIRHHIAAEALMSLALIAGGALTLVGVAVGPGVLALGLGMALYSIVNSAGSYVQRRQLPLLVMFAVLFALTAVATGFVVAGG